MAKIILPDASNGNSGIQRINDNFRKVEEALNDKVLYRDNPVGEPNQMENDLDMNSKRVYNLPQPVLDHEAVPWGLMKDSVESAKEYAAAAAISAAMSAASALSAKDSERGSKRYFELSLEVAEAVTTGGFHRFETKALAEAGSVPEGEFAEVFSDESVTGLHTLYKKEGGVLAQVLIYDGYLQRGAGATVRSFADKLSEVISVKDFGAKGDGVADDTLAITAAIAYSILVGCREVMWPEGSYLTSTNIPLFHSVIHVGSGKVVRGAYTYTITPNVLDTNTIYVASDGNNGNDGLSPAQPIKTLSKINSILRAVGAQSRGGVWVFSFAAGTYIDSSNFTNVPQYQNSIVFRGAGSDRNPLTVFEGTGAAYQTAGMFFQNYMKVSLDKLKFQNFPNGYGAYAQWNCKLEITNCAADNCQNGFAAAYNSFLRLDKSSASNCTGAGARVTYNAQGDIGDGSGGSLANSFRATNCTNGVQVSRGSIAHVDYCELWDCDAGLTVDLGARAAALGSDFRRNGVGVRIWSSSEISLSPSQPLVYHQDEPSEANTKTIEYRGGGRDSALRGQAGSGEYRVFKDFVTSTVTGTVAATQVKGTLFTAEKGYMVDPDTRLRVVVTGQVTSSPTGTVQLLIRASTTAMAFISTPVGASGDFIAEFEISPAGPGTQWGTSKLSMQGQPCQVGVLGRSVDFATSDRPFSLWVDPNGALPITVDVYKVEVFMLG